MVAGPGSRVRRLAAAPLPQGPQRAPPRLGLAIRRRFWSDRRSIGLLGHYSNQDLQGSLARLARKLATVRASGGPPRQPATCRPPARPPGWVAEALHLRLA